MTHWWMSDPHNALPENTLYEYMLNKAADRGFDDACGHGEPKCPYIRVDYRKAWEMGFKKARANIEEAIARLEHNDDNLLEPYSPWLGVRDDEDYEA